jgi:hypothetical protein
VNAVVRSPWGTKSINLNGGAYDPSSSPADTATQASLPSVLGLPNLGNLAITGAFLLGGVALVVLGLWRSTTNQRAAVQEKTQSVATAAAVVA